ncbi:monooxygenase [Coprinopsis cinerea okayama7|uniref:Monooxygenase n=1 Tax=Coprinopsis cinerea (strain Okayama-7 / 130 / ATCC MYA-4618 / FGSC 9003) TaxID=240176 RepID=A8P1K6_COPC7|nr:monooxygenase [Coprinopsis cinerea okayama7\|eukprot:XP_001838118.1 monooxygenase [Coprinopsis cinerea okayama7\
MAPLRFSFLVLAVALQSIFLSQVFAAPAPVEEAQPFQRRAKCANIRIRKEWRDLTVAERQDYIRAVKCLMSTPSTSTRRGVVSRFDEFQACHIDLTDEVHQVGHFLAWHRHFLTLYANAMRDECGYQGPATYWDWSRDADGPGRMRDSPVFDPVTGFGGDGATSSPSPNPGNPGFPGFPGFPGGGGGCVATGPFNTTRLNLGPGTAVGEHCLTRAIGDQMKSSLTSANVQATLAQTTFETFRTTLENGGRAVNGFGIHGGGHAAVGGEMVNPYSSPGDPLFYLHHGNLDRIWWKWQSADLANRLNAISGPTTQRPPFTNVTLNFMMPYTSLIPPLAVREIMDIEAEPSCFQYAD